MSWAVFHATIAMASYFAISFVLFNAITLFCRPTFTLAFHAPAEGIFALPE